MNTTPRALNRLILAVVGLLVLATGAAGLAVLVLPGVSRWWTATAPGVGEEVDGLRARTTLDGQADTWLWLVLAAVIVVLIVLLVLWILAQGRGRAGLYSGDAPSGGRRRSRGGAQDGSPAGTNTPGTVTVSATAAEQLLKAALLERPDLAGASVSTWSVRGVPGLRVRVYPRKGAPPYGVAAEVSELVEALDVVMGLRVPVLISIASGTRVRFTKAERVS